VRGVFSRPVRRPRSGERTPDGATMNPSQRRALHCEPFAFALAALFAAVLPAAGDSPTAGAHLDRGV
jgi:hypothetical protein